MSTIPPPLPPVIPTQRTEALQPVMPKDRIEIVDVLRGFALLGILLVNIALFSWPVFYEVVSNQPWEARRDIIAEWLGRFLAEGKFYPLFSFLFGLGISIQMERARRQQRSFANLLSRRLLILLAIGLAHAFLIWEGDILVCYAVCGFVLLAFQERKAKTLLIWAAVCLVLPVLLYALIWGFLALVSMVPEAAKGIDQEFARERAHYEKLVQDNLRIFSTGTLGEIFVQRARNVLSVWQFTWFFAPTFFAMFLLGLYAGQRRLLQDIEAHLGLIRRALCWGFALGLPANVFFAFGSSRGSALDIDFVSVLTMAATAIGGPALALGYAAALILLARREAWRGKFRPVAAAGRMALTNYLLQSLICTTLCYSYGLGLYGSLGRAAGLGLALAIYGAQLIISVWWLRRFRFGPAEWLWRTLTYGTRQPMRVSVSI